MSVDLPSHLDAKVRRIADRNNASYASVVRAAVKRYLERLRQERGLRAEEIEVR